MLARTKGVSKQIRPNLRAWVLDTLPIGTSRPLPSLAPEYGAIPVANSSPDQMPKPCV